MRNGRAGDLFNSLDIDEKKCHNAICIVSLAYIYYIGRKILARTIRQQLALASIALGALHLGAGSAQAGNIEYLVNQVKGEASVSGSITTDGTLGALGGAHVLSWNLLLDDGPSTFTLTGANSQLFGVSNWSASASQLFFDFGGDAGTLIQNPVIGSGINYLGFDTAWGGIGGGYSAIDWRVNGALTVINYSGVQAFATAAPAVPEPAVPGMLLIGVGLIGLAARRRQSEAFKA